MNNINFTSTYRIPISTSSASAGKTSKLIHALDAYPNKLISSSNNGSVRISIPDENDAKFIQKLKSIGYKIFQIFEGENVNRGNLDSHIKSKLSKGDYVQVGKQKRKISASGKQKFYNVNKKAV